jgi:predicted  nucleic acid-binding Zn ribbon protein
MMTALGDDPLHCINCNGIVRLDTVGLTPELDARLGKWARAHCALEVLEIESGDYEAWAVHELADLASPINRMGLDLRRAVGEIYECYYWLFWQVGRERVRVCPVCKRPMTPWAPPADVQPAPFAVVRCESHWLAASGSDDSR